MINPKNIRTIQYERLEERRKVSTASKNIRTTQDEKINERRVSLHKYKNDIAKLWKSGANVMVFVFLFFWLIITVISFVYTLLGFSNEEFTFIENLNKSILQGINFTVICIAFYIGQCLLSLFFNADFYSSARSQDPYHTRSESKSSIEGLGNLIVFLALCLFFPFFLIINRFKYKT